MRKDPFSLQIDSRRGRPLPSDAESIGQSGLETEQLYVNRFYEFKVERFSIDIEAEIWNGE